MYINIPVNIVRSSLIYREKMIVYSEGTIGGGNNRPDQRLRVHPDAERVRSGRLRWRGRVVCCSSLPVVASTPRTEQQLPGHREAAAERQGEHLMRRQTDGQVRRDRGRAVDYEARPRHSREGSGGAAPSRIKGFLSSAQCVNIGEIDNNNPRIKD